jgi:hypothetical protein
MTAVAVRATPHPCAGATSAGAPQNFTYEEIVPCLNTALKIGTFMANNWVREPEATFRPAHQIYDGMRQGRYGDCKSIAELICDLIRRNEIGDAYHVGFSINTATGHNSCLWRDRRTGEWYFMESNGYLAAPKQSMEELIDFYWVQFRDGPIWVLDKPIDHETAGAGPANFPGTRIQ